MRKSWLFAVAALSLGVAACASLGAQDKENMLAAAGFAMKPADSPAKLANLKAMTQYQLVPHVKNGKNYYVFADAAGCRCVYVGDESAYQAYQQMRIQQNIADEQLMTAEMNQQAMMNWGAWGPWGPGFY